MVDIKSALLLLALSVTVNGQCILTAPNVNLLSAQGLATAWQLSGGCTQASITTQTFLESTIYEPAKKMIFSYTPLVIDAGTTPLVPPVVPNITPQAIIVYHGGTNANTVTLKDLTNGTTLANANCVNGLNTSIFTQFFYCNGPPFFAAAKPGVMASKQIIPLGVALDGIPCATTHSFTLVDQDQSDNVVSKYIQVGNQTAQDTAKNRAAFPAGTIIDNGSDNLLLSNFVNPAVGCKSFAVPALDDIGNTRATVASDEILASIAQAPPVALVPLNDPMTLVNGAFSLTKTNLYRMGVGQPLAANNQGADPATYCTNLGNIGPPVILKQGTFTANFTSPVPAMGNTLFTFLGARFNASWINLGCIGLTGKQSPIIAHLDGNGVATNLTFSINGTTIGPTATGGTNVMNTTTPANTTVPTASAPTAANKTGTASMTNKTGTTIPTASTANKTGTASMVNKAGTTLPTASTANKTGAAAPPTAPTANNKTGTTVPTAANKTGAAVPTTANNTGTTVPTASMANNTTNTTTTGRNHGYRNHGFRNGKNHRHN